MNRFNKTILLFLLVLAYITQGPPRRGFIRPSKKGKHEKLDRVKLNYKRLVSSIKTDKQRLFRARKRRDDNQWGGCNDGVAPVCWIRPPLDLVPGTSQWYDCCWRCNRGMTMKLIHHKPMGNLDYVKCSGTGCNWQMGDTPCYLPLPILCIQKHNLPDPQSLFNNCCFWSGGTIRLTEPIQGCVLQSKAHADSICEDRFGCGWEMADYHSANYDNFYAHGNIGITPWVINYFAWGLYGRFWVAHHQHNAAHCWDSPDSV